ncbi:protein of unknown function [Taphrina deformans PYCC 5710]|uniref:Enoyl reductase (ER) domain-containing protein n=1 Tax=Taphrina deformans (strain PYCC 5710 / ATCC 11124 / CBS 356.35 / IMI 108563 / JCM 9778 / NBRC 8474) TaxID=1097556 RepID=R4X6K9_TAPDE|nr:protein of unknown function [Taphrina deformans PYCC 5710]|eukprot:CCG80775.1 protein of unknown function [Taphrina deformans PYCC 5710]
MTERETRAALPSFIPYYSFSNGRVVYNIEGKATPGKHYLDSQEILVRVYNSTIAEQAGFSGEVIALGDYVDSCGVNDYVFGGGLTSLQQYITVKAEEVCNKPRDLCFADAARLHAGTILYENLQHIPTQSTVLILGDMTGFAAQICREKGCFITSSEDFDCGEQSIIDSDNFLEWLENHDFIYDIVIDASGDLDIYNHCHKFTTKRAEYISINPDNALQAVKSSLLPSFLGGGTRKLKIARPASGVKKSQLLAQLAAKVLKDEYEVKNPRIVNYRSVSSVESASRYVTAVNVIEQKDITPEDPEYNLKEGRASDRKTKIKGKEKVRRPSNSARTASVPTTPTNIRQKSGSTAVIDALTGSPKRPISPASPVVHPYSPRIQSRLKHSISASLAPEMKTLEPPQASIATGSGAVTNALLGTPERTASPKISVISRPPSSLQHRSEMQSHDKNFEQIELQSFTGRTATRDISDSESDDDDVDDRTPVLARPIARAVDPSPRPSEPVRRTSPLRQSSLDNEAPVAAPVQTGYADEDDDVSSVEIDAVPSPEPVPVPVSTAQVVPDKSEQELKQAQAQIELLQQQVNALLAAKNSPEVKQSATADLVDV